MKDLLGNDLVVGDRIAYATRHGSHIELIVADVEQVSEDRIKARPIRGGPRSHTVYVDSRTGEDLDWQELEVLHTAKAGVYTYEDHEFSPERFHEWSFELCSKPHHERQPHEFPGKYRWREPVYNDYVTTRDTIPNLVTLKTPGYIVKLGPSSDA